MPIRRSFWLLWLLGACGDDGRPDTGGASEVATVSATGTSTTGTTGAPTGTTGDAPTSAPVTSTATTVTKLDVGPPGTTTSDDTTTGTPVDMCKVQDDMNAIGDCAQTGPPDSFEPEIQWSWPGHDGDVLSIITPLVANLTDDNGDGAIDLCDVPDIVVVASKNIGTDGHIYVLDGATGSLHFRIEQVVSSTITPAIGDIDGDGLPEIVAVTAGNYPIAFEHDGTLKWLSTGQWLSAFLSAVALADVDNDGDVEIIGGSYLYDHEGKQLWQAPGTAVTTSATTAADLDGDGDLEIVIGHMAMHHDGSVYYMTNIVPGFPQVADLDDDPEPEILVTNDFGLMLLDHDGLVLYQDLRPTGDQGGELVWRRPATVQDFDGDNVSDFAVSSGDHYATYHGDASILWVAPVSDNSGIAAGTAFDFLGDGIAEAMYADEHFLFAFDGAGQPLLQVPRKSVTGIEYPIVADIDNDSHVV